MVSPLVGAIEAAPLRDLPIRAVAEMIVDVFVNEIYGTRRKDVIRLILAEGPRFPKLAEFYYREVIAPRAPGHARAADAGGGARRARPRRAGALSAIAGRARPGRDHVERPVRALRAARRAPSSCTRISICCSAKGARHERTSHRPRLARGARPRRLRQRQGADIPGLDRGRADLRRPRRGRPHRDAGRARRRPGRAALPRCSRSMPICSLPTSPCRRRRSRTRSSPMTARWRSSRPSPARNGRWTTPRRLCARRRRGSTRRRPGWRAARCSARSPAASSRSITGWARWCRPASRSSRCCRRAT